MGIFQNRMKTVASASPNTKLPFFPAPCLFEQVEIEAVKWNTKRGKAHVKNWIVQGRVLVCSGDAARLAANAAARSQNPTIPEAVPYVGQAFSWVQKIDESDDEQSSMADGSIKGFIFAVLGVDPGDDAGMKARLGAPPSITDEQWGGVLDAVSEQFCAPQNPQRGKIVTLATVEIKTKGKGLPFTIHDWRPFRGAAVPAKAAGAQVTA